MPYYAYMAGFCRYCGEDLGLVDQNGGRNRQYCNDAHRKAASRKRQEGAKRDQVLSRNRAFLQYWQENGIEGDTLIMLQNILVNHGQEAARAATDAVLVAIRQTRSKYTLFCR